MKKVARIILGNPNLVNLINAEVSQGTISPPSDFGHGDYGEFWLKLIYKTSYEIETVARRCGSYEAGHSDQIVENIRTRIKREMNIIKEHYREQCEMGPVLIDLDIIARKLMRGYKDITENKEK